jgi:hypothetical protein
MSLIELLLATQPSQLPVGDYGEHSLSITNDSYNHGEDIPINPQADGIFSPANKNSIHSNGNVSSSYSLNGSNVQGAQNIYNAYNLPPNLLGLASNNLPSPAILDLDGEKPSPLYFTTDRSTIDFD